MVVEEERIVTLVRQPKRNGWVDVVTCQTRQVELMCTGTVEQLTEFTLNVGKEEIVHEGFFGVAEHIVQEPANRIDILQKGLQIYSGTPL